MGFEPPIKRTAAFSDGHNRAERLRRFFAEEIWQVLPPAERGRSISKREREEILGYGEAGV